MNDSVYTIARSIKKIKFKTWLLSNQNTNKRKISFKFKNRWTKNKKSKYLTVIKL
jgi:hypothetical protein